MRRLKRLPSPAMVVAAIALFAAVGGTSYAAVTGSITTRDIRNGTIRNEDFKDGTLRGQEFKRDSLGGGAVKEQSLDGTKIPKVAEAARADTAASADASTRSEGLARQLTVGADGSKANDRGVVSVAKTDTGRYQVVFDRDVRTCAFSATLVQSTAPADRPELAGTGQIAVAPIADNANGVRIVTAGSGGAYQDRAFHLLLSC